MENLAAMPVFPYQVLLLANHYNGKTGFWPDNNNKLSFSFWKTVTFFQFFFLENCNFFSKMPPCLIKSARPFVV